MWLVSLLIPPAVSGWIIRGISLMRRPRWLVRTIIRWYIRGYAIDVTIIAKPVAEYSCLLDFFLRELKLDARPVCDNPGTIISPVDAVITAAGCTGNNEILLVKGTPYVMNDLLGRDAGRYNGGVYVMLYLSPADCHRIYAPCDAQVVDSWYIDGKLRPVFPAAVRRYPNTFVTNKRVITELEAKHGRISMIKIGATNVGRIPVNHPVPPGEADPITYAKAEEVGRFEFGSTVVMLFEKGKYQLAVEVEEGRQIRIGELLALEI